jgi:hypothetical protein
MRSTVKKRFAAGLGALAVFGVPAVAIAASTDSSIVPGTLTTTLTGSSDVAAQMRRHAHRELVGDTVRLARRHAKLEGEKLRKGYRKAISNWSNERLERKQRSLRRDVRELRRTGGAPDVAIPAHLKAIAQCESGGNPRAIGGGGMYRGAYQFSYATWAAVGGKGDPAAASMEEQTRRAAILYARAGAGQWPICGS